MESMSISQIPSNQNPSTINEILEQINSGDKDAFVYLVDSYRDKIITIAFSFGLCGSERDDLIQEGYIALYKAARTYDSSKALFNTYATLCIKRRMINWIEKNVNPSLSSMSISDLDDNDLARMGMIQENFEDTLIAKNEFHELLAKAKSILSEKEFTVFSLYIKGYTNSEICEKIGITKKSCDNSLFRLRTKLKSAKN